VNLYGHVVNDNTAQWDNALNQPDGLYLNDGNGDQYAFTDVAEAWGFADPGMSRGAVLLDVNHDGWLDIAKRSLDESSIVYVSRCGAEGWLQVVLKQPGTLNRDAVGARVVVTAGSSVQTQFVIAGGVGYASSPAIEAHFGLGMVDMVDTIRVAWPDGAESVLHDVASRQRITITRD
jgi:hypothetical protein